MGRHSSDNTRTVLPRHPSGEVERVRRAEASHINPCHLRPSPLRHGFSDEYVHFAWGPHLELSAASALASPIYTLVDDCPIQIPNGFWEWRYRGRYLIDPLSGIIKDSKCLDRFTPLQLNVFHSLWELRQTSHHRFRPAATSASSERVAAGRAYALLEVPIGTVV